MELISVGPLTHSAPALDIALEIARRLPDVVRGVKALGGEAERIDVVVSKNSGGEATYAEIDSPHGHDAFLIDIDQVASAAGRSSGGVVSSTSSCASGCSALPCA